MPRDEINEIALSITDELVEEGIVIDAQMAAFAKPLCYTLGGLLVGTKKRTK